MKKTTLAKRTKTKSEGIFYKEIVNDSGKVIDKMYGIRWTDENAKPRLKNIGTYSSGIREPYCKKLRDEIIVKIRLGESAPKFAQEKQSFTVSDMAYKYFEFKSSTVKDIDKERRRFENHMKKRIGHVMLQNLTLEDVQLVQKDLAENLSPATIRMLLVNLNAMYKYMVEEQMFKGDIPTRKIKHDELKNTRKGFLSIEQINELLRITKFSSYEIWLFVRLSLATGGRVGTILTIKASDFNLEFGSVKLTDHKNDNEYTGFYDDELKEVIRERISELDSPYDKIIKLGKTSLSYKLGSILDVMCNLHLNKDDRANRIVPHSLRHTFASHLAINGTPILTIQKLMNHKSYETTMIYAKLAPDQGIDAVKNLYKSI